MVFRSAPLGYSSPYFIAVYCFTLFHCAPFYTIYRGGLAGGLDLALHKLTAAQIRNVTTGKFSDGSGLWFVKRNDGGAQWVLRVTIHGRRREMGLGRFPDVSLKEAREAAEKWRGVVRQGLDPIKARDQQRRGCSESSLAQ